jgi:hypothetical protein
MNGKSHRNWKNKSKKIFEDETEKNKLVKGKKNQTNLGEPSKLRLIS